MYCCFICSLFTKEQNEFGKMASVARMSQYLYNKVKEVEETSPEEENLLIALVKMITTNWAMSSLHTELGYKLNT